MVQVLSGTGMPEGPSIIIAKEAIKDFKNKKILKASGNAKIDLHKLENKKIIDIKTWGKHLLICFDGFFLRIHFLMFGTYRINERKEAKPRLQLKFSKTEINFYTCAILLIEKDPNEVYDWTADTLNKEWDPTKALQKIKKSGLMVCDVLLDQTMFSGVGNIIKNEVLFRTSIHPKSKTNKIPLKQQRALIKDAVQYSFDFLKWKKAFVLKKHWLIYTKKICPRCNIQLHKEWLGKTKRRTFFCNNCQVLYK